ncbi:MAG: ABC transporter ATP-binding protein [Candidatus Zixiibacteriota bacterium]|nr:MAG: ABC transporter ATP-binding protein [candidate division Zixibacteria bacterium]
MDVSYHDEEILGKAYDNRLMKRLLTYLKPYRRLVLLSVAILLLSSLTQLAGPYLTKVAIDKYITAGDSKGLLRIIFLFMGVIALGFSLEYIRVYLMEYIGQKAMYDMRMEIFSHVQELNLTFFDKNPVGRILTRITFDVNVLNEMFTSGVVAIFGDIFILIGIVVVMLLLKWQLALIVFSVIPFLVIATAVFRKKVRQSYRDVRTATARINAYTQEHITGISVVQSFTVEQKAYSGFEKINKNLMNARLRSVFYYAVFFPVVELIGAFSLVLIIGYGGSKVIAGTLTLGALVAFIQYADRFYRPIRDLSEKYNILQSAMASSERIFKLLDTKSDIINPENPIPLNKVQGKIEFKDLYFEYEKGNPVLYDINLKIQPGEKIAIVGVTGSGKTTLINLLCRFYEYKRGEILIDGVSLKKIREKDLRKNIALVLQDVFMFAGDIKRNIRLDSKEISLERIKQAAFEVGADKFIDKLDGGLDFQLKERGLNLSVGQRQIIAFARALVFDPAILILDEATSSVDTETEILIQKALKKLLAGRTSIIIAHRLSTIKGVDRIVVMHKGKIREIGTHDELLQKRGIYSRLYQLQYKDQEVTIVDG